MAAVRHLGIVASSYRTTHVGPHHPVKFYANPIHRFEDSLWRFEFFAELA